MLSGSGPHKEGRPVRAEGMMRTAMVRNRMGMDRWKPVSAVGEGNVDCDRRSRS